MFVCVRERECVRESRAERGGPGQGGRGVAGWGVLTPGSGAASQGALPAPTAMPAGLPAWETYFFMCPYGPAKLWNVKKYVFQVGNSLAGGRGQRAHGAAQGTDRWAAAPQSSGAPYGVRLSSLALWASVSPPAQRTGAGIGR